MSGLSNQGKDVGQGYLPAGVEFDHELRRRALDRMEVLSRSFRLLHGSTWADGIGDGCVGGNRAAFGNDLPLLGFARVAPIRSEAEAAAISEGFGVTARAAGRDGWTPGNFVTRFYAGEGLDGTPPSPAETLAVSARRLRSKAPEGFFFCNRRLLVSRTYSGRLRILYQLYGDGAYVVPKARGHGLAGALVIAAAEQVALDMAEIRRGMDAFPPRARPGLVARLTGEAHSNGGLWMLNALCESVDAHARVSGFRNLECEADYSL
jgi:GNAT superfamily N-acetyltransferase